MKESRSDEIQDCLPNNHRSEVDLDKPDTAPAQAKKA